MKKITFILLSIFLLGFGLQAQIARLQVIHNAADPAAASVDVWVNGGAQPFIDNFTFREATPFVNVPSGVTLNIAVAPDTSTTANSAIATFAIGPLMTGQTYVLFANGTVGSGFTANPDGINIGFDLFPYAPAQEASGDTGEVDVLVFHGSTDAPTVDVDVRVGGNAPVTLINDLAYTDFNPAGYVTVPPAVYVLDVKDATGSTVVASFIADISSAGGAAAVVFASGFFNAGQGPAFGLWIALPDGTTFPLPTPGTARVQVIHNSPDPLAGTVDIYVNGWQTSTALDDLSFRDATDFFDVQTGYETIISLNGPTSTDADSFVVGRINFGTALMDSVSYVLIANGLLDTTGNSNLNPEGINPSFTLIAVGPAAETGSNSSNADLLIHHGSPDAPSVDVVARNVGTLADNLPYLGTNPGYLSVPANTYIVDVKDSTSSTTVKSYYAPLSTAAGASAVVFASGFLNPANGAPFMIWVALPDGTTFPLPEIGTARAQIIHNSADAAAAVVDIYIQDEIGDVIAVVDSVPFRTATSFVDLPSTVPLTVAFAAYPSNSINDAVASVALPALANEEKYIVIANGILSPSGYDPSPAFDLNIYTGAREQAANQGANETDVLVYHGSTDAPTVDVVEVGLGAGTIVDDINYGEFQGYLSLGTNDYRLAIRDASGTSTVATYDAPLAQLNLADAALTVLASGFLDPSMNSNGPAFGLYAALPTGGPLVPLPVAVGIEDREEFMKSFSVYPNPVVETVKVNFTLEETEKVTLKVYNIAGQVVKTLDAGMISAGVNMLETTVGDMQTGQYLLELNVGESTKIAQPILVK